MARWPGSWRCVSRAIVLIVLAIDGQPATRMNRKTGGFVLGPAMRLMSDRHAGVEPGRRYAVIDDFYDDLVYTLTHLAYDEKAPFAPILQRPSGAARAIRSPEPDLADAVRHDLVLQGGMMGGMMG